VRSTDGQAALHGRGPLASGSRFLFITTNVIIDSVESPTPEEESYLPLGSILKTRPVLISLPSSDGVIAPRVTAGLHTAQLESRSKGWFDRGRLDPHDDRPKDKPTSGLLRSAKQPSVTWSAITGETLPSGQLFDRTSDLPVTSSSLGYHPRVRVLAGTSYKAGEFPSVREGVNLVDMNRVIGWMKSDDARHSRYLPAVFSVSGTAGRPPLCSPWRPNPLPSSHSFPSGPFLCQGIPVAPANI
jgi:hypothetical protein